MDKDTIGIVVIPQEEVQQMMTNIKQMIDEVRSMSGRKLPSDQYINHKDLLKFFGLSDRTIRKWRDEGKLAFSKPSDHCYMYKWSDIDDLIDTFREEPWAIQMTKKRKLRTV